MKTDVGRDAGTLRSSIALRMVLVLPVLVAFALLVFCPSGAVAHITKAEMQFSDIAQSDARFDIGLLVAAGIIPKTPLFQPDRPLTRVDVAAWSAYSKGKSDHEKKPDIDALAKSALAARQVASLDGAATFADLARIFFQGEIVPERKDDVPTRAEAARFLARNLTAKVGGSTVLESMGLKMGAAGDVMQVQEKVTESGGKTFFVTIGQATLPMYAHGQVGGGPVNLSAWKGHAVRRALIRTEGGHDMWTYVETAESF